MGLINFFCRKRRIGFNNKIKIIKKHYFPHSIGMFYATMTEFLGYNPELDEWKIMGASAYGDYKKFYKKLKVLDSKQADKIEPFYKDFISIAKNLLNVLDDEAISQTTGLSIDEIKKL